LINITSLKQHYKLNDSSSELDILSTNNNPLSPETVNVLVCLRLDEQDAQLSQRDRAAECVIVLAKSGRLEHGRQYFTDIIGLSSTTVI